MMDDVPAGELYAALVDEDFSSESEEEELQGDESDSCMDVEPVSDSACSDSEAEFQVCSEEDEDDDEESLDDEQGCAQDYIVDTGGTAMKYKGRCWPLNECCDAFAEKYISEGLPPGRCYYEITEFVFRQTDFQHTSIRMLCPDGVQDTAEAFMD